MSAQRAGVLLATILLYGCTPPDSVSTTATSADPPGHVAVAPAPAGARIDESNDADSRCRLATRLTEGVESCLSSDADHDGIDDSEDRCPDTTPGVAVDATGCALPGSDL